jgi:hypothetical protein
MPRGIDQIQAVGLAVARAVIERHALGLDSDAAFALDVHGIEYLLLHLAFLETAAHLNKAVGQGGFTVIDMGDDREISDQQRIPGGHAGPHMGSGSAGMRRSGHPCPPATHRTWEVSRKGRSP